MRERGEWEGLWQCGGCAAAEGNCFVAAKPAVLTYGEDSCNREKPGAY